MKLMKALRFDQYGAPEVLKLREVVLGELLPGEVLIEVHAAAINPSDVKNVRGLFQTPLPRVPGRDYAGVVVKGDGLVGLEVWGSGAGFGMLRDGAHAQYVIAPADGLSEKPLNLSMAQAAAVGAPFVTAWTALVRAASLRAGEVALIVGVSGAVGRAAVQIAHLRKAAVIGVARAAANPAGADTLIDSTSAPIPEAVMAATNGKGVDVVLDTVGGPMFEPALRCLAVGGRHVAITSVGERRVSLDLVDFYHNQSRLIGVDTIKLTAAEIAGILNAQRSAFEDGRLLPPEVETSAPEEAVAAYGRAALGGGKKQVLVFHPG